MSKKWTRDMDTAVVGMSGLLAAAADAIEGHLTMTRRNNMKSKRVWLLTLDSGYVPPVWWCSEDIRENTIPIDIPEGCRLAVVGEAASFVDHNPFTHNNEVVMLSDYRRVVQEIPL